MEAISTQCHVAY